jgi:hypothetical protein
MSWHFLPFLLFGRPLIAASDMLQHISVHTVKLKFIIFRQHFQFLIPLSDILLNLLVSTLNIILWCNSTSSGHMKYSRLNRLTTPEGTQSDRWYYVLPTEISRYSTWFRHHPLLLRILVSEHWTTCMNVVVRDATVLVRQLLIGQFGTAVTMSCTENIASSFYSQCWRKDHHMLHRKLQATDTPMLPKFLVA